MTCALARRLAAAPHVAARQLAERRFVRGRDDQREIADAGRAVAGLARELRVLLDRDRVDRDVEGVDLHPVGRPFVVRALVRPHRELAAGIGRETRDGSVAHLGR